MIPCEATRGLNSIRGMGYAETRELLGQRPFRRIRVRLNDGGVLETPRSQMATPMPQYLVLSTDGSRLRRLAWDKIREVELLPPLN
jgi:hypothetical protein